MATLKSHGGVFVVVGTRGETVGLELTWAHNLFVVDLRISYYESFSAERLKATPS